MSKLLETLAHDAEQVLESELPAVHDVRALVVSLARRVEAELPQLAERSLEDVMAAITPKEPVESGAPAGASSSPASPAADVPVGAPLGTSQPIGSPAAPADAPALGEPGALAAAAGVEQLPATAEPGAALPPTSAAAPADEAAPIASEPAAGDTDLDRELADAQRRVLELEAQRASAANAAAADAPAVTTDATPAS